MLTIEKSKEMLNRDGLNYTDEEVKQIREFIYILAEIDYQLFKRKQDERLNQFQSENKTEVEKEKQAEKNKLKLQTNETQSHSIHPREYRRAS